MGILSQGRLPGASDEPESNQGDKQGGTQCSITESCCMLLMAACTDDPVAPGAEHTELGRRRGSIHMAEERGERVTAMFKSFLPVIVAGTLGFTVQPAQPQIAEVGVYAGGYWPETGERDFVRMTTGVTAYAPLRSDHFGVELGAAYKQGGYTWNCWPCFEPEDDGESLRDYLDFSLLARARLAFGDRLDVRLMAGPTWGVPVRCREKNLTRGTERDCKWSAGTDLRLVAGAGAALRLSRHIDLTASYRYGLDPREFGVEVDGGSDIASSSLIAGIAYRRAG